MDFAKIFNTEAYGQILAVIDQVDEFDVDENDIEDASDYSKITLTFDPKLDNIQKVTTAIIIEEDEDNDHLANAYKALEDLDQESAEHTVGMTYSEVMKAMSPSNLN